MELLAEYHLWIMIAVLVGLIVLPQKHRKKKSILFLITILAFSIGYELIMSEPVTEMPGRINRYLNQDGASTSENPHYYTTPDERLKKQEASRKQD
jgi:NAD/NADP transhydrogenase beta subunit